MSFGSCDSPRSYVNAPWYDFAAPAHAPPFDRWCRRHHSPFGWRAVPPPPPPPPPPPHSFTACQELVTLRAGEPIKCNKCGGRILYKLRTKNVVQYEAR